MKLTAQSMVWKWFARLALTGLMGIVIALALIILAPATWLDRALVHASRGHLMLAATTGRLWNGQGTLQAILPGGEASTLAHVQWRVTLDEVLLRRLGLRVSSYPDNQTILTARMGPAGIELYRLRIELPAALLGALSASLRELEPGGKLTVSARDLNLVSGRHSGEVEIIWQEAVSSLASVHPLGSYRLHLTGGGDRIDLVLSTPGSAALILTGRGQWRAGNTLRFDGHARSDTHAHELTPLLRILGRETTPGSYQLRLDPNVGAV